MLDYDEAVALVCQATGWPVGHAWISGTSSWRSSGAWYAATASYAALRDCTALTDLGSGRGIVAAVLHLQACRFLSGLDGLGSPARAAQARAAGLRAVVGVPVRDGHDEIVAVLEFVTAAEVEPDGELADALLELAARARRRTTRTSSKAAARPRATVAGSAAAERTADEPAEDLAG